MTLKKLVLITAGALLLSGTAMARVLENAKEYQEQFFKVVRRDQVEIHYNGEWFSKLPFSKVTELMGQFTVAQMLEREDFKPQVFTRM